MAKPTDQQASHQPADALIAEALTATRIPPTIDRCEHLNAQLRARIAALIPVVQGQADRMDRGHVGWYNRRRLLDHTQATLGQGLGAGLMSAALHVEELARHCRALARYAGESAS